MSTFKHNKVDIYIRERNGTRQIRVPWLPATIEYTAGEMTTAKYDILNRGEVQVPAGTGLAKISWESQFPGKNRSKSYLMRGAWSDPSKYHKILESWLAKGTSLNVMVTGYPINKDVYLTSYKATPGGGFGDIEYSVEFTEERDISITSRKLSTSSGASKPKKTNKDTNKKTKRKSKSYTTYTIKSGDTLWGIARKKLGNGSKWKTIYNRNKSIIEKTAKKRGLKSSNNGWWIFPGTKIQIPKK